MHIYSLHIRKKNVWLSLFAVAKKIGYFYGPLNVKMCKELKSCGVGTELIVVS